MMLTIAASGSILAQEGAVVWPPEIYSGENVITVKPPTGVRRIDVRHTPNVIVEGDGRFSSCQTEVTLRVTVTNSDAAELNLAIVDCDNRRYVETLPTGKPWNIDRVAMGTVEVGQTVCKEFQVRAAGADIEIDGLSLANTIFLDSISVADSRATVRVPGHLPVKINSGTTYTYRVCFLADKPGAYYFPVTTWIRRRYASGGLTSYPVADTGYVRVVPKPVPPDTLPVRPPDTARISYTPPPAEPPITDPTTFRTIAVPNAIIPKAGTLYVGSYDLLGVTAGYSLDRHLMVIAGGALPTPDDWSGAHGDIFGAYSLGLKVGLPLAADLNVAAGYQWGRSFFNREEIAGVTRDTVRSEITVQAPYAAISYGDDDSRLSATFGYAFKHHVKTETEFDQNAAFIAIGGDYRIGRHWKLAGEIISMQTLGLMPIVATGRYFTETFAIDFGAAFVGITTGDAKAPAIPLVPVVSGVFTF